MNVDSKIDKARTYSARVLPIEEISSRLCEWDIIRQWTLSANTQEYQNVVISSIRSEQNLYLSRKSEHMQFNVKGT